MLRTQKAHRAKAQAQRPKTSTHFLEVSLNGRGPHILNVELHPDFTIPGVCLD